MRRARIFVVLSLVGATVALGVPALTAAAPNDELYRAQWGPQQIRAEEAWAKSQGAGVTIGIVDSGIDFSHPDLDAKIVKGNTFIDCGKAGCGDGS